MNTLILTHLIYALEFATQISKTVVLFSVSFFEQTLDHITIELHNSKSVCICLSSDISMTKTHNQHLIFHQQNEMSCKDKVLTLRFITAQCFVVLNDKMQR